MTTSLTDACASARRAQQEFASSTSLADRARLLRKLRGALLKNAEHLIDVVMRESGKVRFEAIALEVTPSALALTYNAHVVEEALAPEKMRGFLPIPRRAVRSWMPRGVLGLISPYNYTLSIPMSTLAPAIAAGNAVVWKPAPTGTAAARELVRVLEDAGLPSDLVIVVDGGAEVGQALVDAPIDHLTFVGSTSAGRRVAARCGERLLPCILELGGNAPAVVAAGADLDRAAHAIVYGALANAGQSCVAVERVLAVPEVFDALLEKTRALADRVRIGDDVARVLPAQREKVEAWKAKARAAGARFHGDVVVEVNDAPAFADGEIFGPVIPFERVRDLEDAIARANAVPQKLCAYVFGAKGRSAEIAQRLDAPHVVVGDAMVSYAMMELPFGGDGASGFGRVHGVDGLRALCREKVVVDGQVPFMTSEPWWLPYQDKVGEALLKGLEKALSLRERVPW